jgi:hypothetical protein
MLEDAFSSLSFIAGPAILTNASAILQNGATTRYNLAITQWREFNASQAAGDDTVSLQYVSPEEAIVIARRRIRLQLRGLCLLNGAVAVFAATTVLGLAGAFLVQSRAVPAVAMSLGMSIFGCAGLFALLVATATFFFESACSAALLRLHREFGGQAARTQGRPTTASWTPQPYEQETLK